MSKEAVLKPHLSEKAYQISLNSKKYALSVPINATKSSVAQAVKAQFNVNVVKVNIANIKGKPKRTINSSGRAAYGHRGNIKRAYITLKEGDSLPFFEKIEKEAEDEKKIEEKSKKEVEKIQAEQPKESEVKTKRSIRKVFSHSQRQTQNRGGDK